jgi:hypothetical protein
MKYNKSLLLLLFVGVGLPAFAQTGPDWFVTGGIGSFVLAIIAGILLAFAFQFILVNLAVASGITAMGDLRKKDHDSTEKSSRDDSSNTPAGVKISSAIGLFILLTMTISLFFASWIAVKLSLVPNNTIGMILGLVIWAGYLLIGLYIDSKVIASFAGSFFSTVRTVLSSGASAVGDVFKTSRKKEMKESARETVKAIHDEIRQEYDLTAVHETLDEYIRKLEPQKIDMDNLHNHLAELINEIEIKEQYTPDDPEATKRLFLEVAGKQPNLSAKDKEKLKNTFDQIKEALKSEGSRSDKAMALADKLTPGSEEEGRRYRDKVEQYLRETGREEIHPDQLKDDINRILNNPKAAPEILKARVSRLDRSTVKALITMNNGISEDKAEKYLSKVEELLNQIKSKASQVNQEAGVQRESVQGQSRHKMNEQRSQIEQKIQQWFDRMNRPELAYDRLKYDVRRVLDDPKTTPAVLKNRLRHMDRDSLIALVSNNQKISREQAENLADKIEEAKQEVIHKTEQIERKINTKVEELKQEGLRQAEGARKTAAAAAWWILMATVVSGAASAVGGILALTV